MDPHRKGDLTEAIVIAELTQRSITVSRPFGDNERYDLLVESPMGDWLRIQVKTGWINNGLLEFHTRSQHTNAKGNVYKPYDDCVDFFIVYSSALEELYLVGTHEFDVTVSLRVDEPRHRQRTMQWAEFYRFDDRWPPHELAEIRGKRPATPMFAIAVEALEDQGSTVWLPRNTLDPAYIVALHDEERHRIRIERGRVEDGRIRFQPRERDRVDWFLVYCEEVKSLYLIDRGVFDSTISLRLEKPEKPRKDTRYACDFEFDEHWPPS